jgi:hypothetical protein
MYTNFEKEIVGHMVHTAKKKYEYRVLTGKLREEDHMEGSVDDRIILK